MSVLKDEGKSEYLDERAVPPAADDYDLGYEDPRVKRIKRKVDLRLSAILSLMYVVNQIDRTNLPNAMIAGMDKDLNLVVGNR